MIADGHALLARAAELRASHRESAPPADWIPIAEAPLARKSIRALARSGAIESRLVRGRRYVSRASLDTYMRGTSATSTNATPDEELRAELGLVRRSA